MCIPGNQRWIKSRQMENQIAMLNIFNYLISAYHLYSSPTLWNRGTSVPGIIILASRAGMEMKNVASDERFHLL